MGWVMPALPSTSNQMKDKIILHQPKDKIILHFIPKLLYLVTRTKRLPRENRLLVAHLILTIFLAFTNACWDSEANKSKRRAYVTDSLHHKCLQIYSFQESRFPKRKNYKQMQFCYTTKQQNIQNEDTTTTKTELQHRNG